MAGEFPFLGGSFKGISTSYDSQRSINLYPEVAESSGARSAVALIGTPGLSIWTTLSGGGCRGMIRFNSSKGIIVCGTKVFAVDTAGTATQLTGAVADGGACSLASNGLVIMMVDGSTNGYFIDPTAMTVTTISAPGFAGGGRVDYLDGYFVWNEPGTQQFKITEILGTSIDPLDFASAEASPDVLVTLIVDHRELWLLGENSGEVWYNAGGSDFPFQRLQAAFLEVGCAAVNSVAKIDNSIMWLATDDRGLGTVQRATGYTPVRVSNHAIEHAISGYSTISDAVAYTYSQEGHSFYMLSFPTAKATWCFDASNGLWHERPYRKNDGTYDRHRSNCQMNFAGKTIVGDWENGNVYEMALDNYTDNGDAIERIRICPHYTAKGKFLFNTALELFMETGVGITSGGGSAPTARLRWSNDGGISWESESWATIPIGAIGATLTRVKWRRLGVSRDRVYEVSISDPVKVVMTGAQLTGYEGRI